MNKRTNIDISTIKLLYHNNKNYILPIVVILVSLFLFIKFIIPQMIALSEAQELIKKENEKLQVLRNNLNLLTSANEQTLDSQLAVTSGALPTNKDFAGILNAVSFAANKTGVFLGDFEFQVGDVSKDNPQIQLSPSLELVLTVRGGVKPTLNFINELYNSVPVSEVLTLEINDTAALLTTSFYYKSYPKTGFSYNVALKPLSKRSLDTIKEISSWNNPKNFEGLVTVGSSPSATPVASPSASSQ